MTFKYEMTKEDYIQYNLDVFDISPSLRLTKAFMKWSIPIAYLILPFVFAQFSDLDYMLWAVTFFIAGLIWILTFPVFMRRSVATRIERLMSENQNIHFIGEHILEFEQEYALDCTLDNQTQIVWQMLQRLVETADYLYLFITPVMALVLPKRFTAQENNPNCEQLKMWISEQTSLEWETAEFKK